MLGCYRSVAQRVSYEVGIILLVIGIVLGGGRINLSE
ncbi:NADH-quinone oxidoreductase subunit H [Escherichia coli]|nr:NADH-quinone oxidoreductase subunit H [Escherichia coli]